MDKCPFCGIVNEHKESSTICILNGHRTHYCYERQLADLQDQVADLKVQLTNLLDELHEDDATIATLQAQVAGMREVVQAVAGADSMMSVIRGVEYETSLVLPLHYKEKAQALLSTTPAGEWVTDHGNKYKHHATTAVEDKKANGTALGKGGEE